MSAGDGKGAVVDSEEAMPKPYHDYALAHVANFSLREAFVWHLSRRNPCSDVSVYELIDNRHTRRLGNVHRQESKRCRMHVKNRLMPYCVPACGEERGFLPFWLPAKDEERFLELEMLCI